MTQCEIIRMAKEAGFSDNYLATVQLHEIEFFAALVAENTGIEQQREIVRLKAIIEEQANGAQNLVLAEREACAKVCEELETVNPALVDMNYAEQCAAAIRARS